MRIAAPIASPRQGPPAVEGVTHRYVTVNGVRYHYAEAGQGEPIILIHGFPQNWYMWREVMRELSTQYRVIALDMRGAGWTEAPAGGYAKAQLADEIAQFMDAVGAPRARVAGHDWGGFVGFQLAMRHPEKVNRYLALGIATPWPNPKALPDIWRIAYQPVLAAPVIGAALLRTPGVVRTMLHGASPTDPWSARDIEAYAAPYRDAAHAAAGSAMYRTFLEQEIGPWLRGEHRATRLEPRTLLLLGALDPIIRPWVTDGYERYSRDMSVEVLEGAGHFLVEEQPAAVIARMREFFR